MNKWIVVALAALALGFSACGDDESSEGSGLENKGGGTGCAEFLDCTKACSADAGASDEEIEDCETACVIGSTQEATSAAIDVMFCAGTSGCEDAECALAACPEEFAACDVDPADYI